MILNNIYTFLLFIPCQKKKKKKKKNIQQGRTKWIKSYNKDISIFLFQINAVL